MDIHTKVNPTRVVVSDLIEAEEKTATGIILPNQVKKKSSMQGKVVLAGRGTDTMPMVWSVGDTVLFRANAGQTFDYEKEEYRILDINDILLGGE